MQRLADFGNWFSASRHASKPFFYASLLVPYVAKDTIRAIWSPWLANTQDVHIGQTELGLLYTAIAAIVVAHFGIRARISRWKRLPSTIISAISLSIAAALLISCNIYFLSIQSSYFPVGMYNIGLAAQITATVLCTIAAALMFVDLAMSESSKKFQSNQQRQVVFANMLFVWYLVLGSVLFHFVEGWSFETSNGYSLSTILTIGYGNIVPKSVGGRILTIIYSIFGIIMVAFLLLSFEDHIEASVNSNEEDGSVDGILHESSTDDGTALGAMPMQLFPTGNSLNTVCHEEKSRDWTTLGIVAAVLIWWFLSSVIIMWLQGISFFDSFWYCFVSMATIGFGDVIVTTPWATQYSHYFLISTILILAICFNRVGKHFKERFMKEQGIIWLNKNASSRDNRGEN